MTEISVGTGVSINKDAYSAAKEASEQALSKLGQKPTISYVFFSGDYDVEKLNAGLKETLAGTEFIGGSADAVFYEEQVLREGIVVASIQSEFLHVGIASADKVSADPETVARQTVLEAMSKLSIDKYIDPYLLFTRMRKGNLKWMVKIPSFFVTVFTRGIKLPKMGDETKIIKGISDEVGLNVPVFGGSLGTAMENVFSGKPYEITLLHSGKILKDGLLIAVNSCSLVYGESIAHGCKRTDKIGYISGVAADGYVVTGISGKPPLDWYAEQIGLSKEEFTKNCLQITQKYPLGVPDNFGNYIIRAGGIPNGENLAFIAPFVEGWPVYVMDADLKNIINAPKEVAEDIEKYTSETEKASLCLALLCSSRRINLQEKLTDELKDIKKQFNGAPVIGFSCFGEIGSKPGIGTGFQHLSSNLFVIYPKLLHELPD